MEEDGKSTSVGNDVSRRKLLGTVAAAGVAGATVAETAAADDDSAVLRTEETDATVEEVDAALSAEPTAQLRHVLDDARVSPDVARRDATRAETYLDGELIATTVEIPTDFGPIKVIGREDETDGVSLATIALERAEVPRRIRRHLAGRAGWPEGTDAHLTVTRDDGTARFARPGTDDERAEAAATIGRDDAPDKLTVETVVRATGSAVSSDRRSGGPAAGSRQRGHGRARQGTYEAAYEDRTVYRLDHTLSRVLETEDFSERDEVHALGCYDYAALCVFDIYMASPHCTAGAVACSVTGVVTWPCVMAVAGFCLPNVAIVHLSGNCYKAYNYCN